MPKEFISPSFIDRLCAPSCMQCRSPMTMALYPGLMLTCPSSNALRQMAV